MIIISSKYQTFKKINEIIHQLTTTAEHKRESLQVMTTATEDRYRQTETKNNNKIPYKGKV